MARGACRGKIGPRLREDPKEGGGKPLQSRNMAAEIETGQPWIKSGHGVLNCSGVRRPIHSLVALNQLPQQVEHRVADCALHRDRDRMFVGSRFLERVELAAEQRRRHVPVHPLAQPLL